ncbi:uncharacterized protein LOC131659732 [Vicia villosa]|uniref:uncharacterized protein LOC131659732 n=1 Tax=Vicia villosa TaxID=3911 RepID=UPI00273AB44B|nr:uncharacterized protein LOC131659732 [Vicia villosa]
MEIPIEVKEAVKVNFEDKVIESNLVRSSLDGLDFISLSLEDSISLEAPFSEEEIKEAVWSCDFIGMSLLFIKRYWYFNGKDIVACFRDFHVGAVLSKSITSYFLSLISKVSNPLGLDDNRPICLVGSIYKIISKLLASRIKKVLSSVISNCKSDFVSGRQMIDSVLVVNEIVDYASKEGKECLMFKGDFEKVYDKVI